jgi:hypothetical protein
MTIIAHRMPIVDFLCEVRRFGEWIRTDACHFWICIGQWWMAGDRQGGIVKQFRSIPVEIWTQQAARQLKSEDNQTARIMLISFE